MKFTDGAWLTAAGVTPNVMRRIFAHRIDGDTLHLYAVDRPGDEGIDRVEGEVLEIAISSPMPDVIRVRTQHHHPASPGVSGFDLRYDLHAASVRIEEQPDTLRFVTGRLALQVDRKRCEFQFEDVGDAGSVVTRGVKGGLAYMDVAGRGGFCSQRLSLGVGECLYGMGERFGPLAKNGQSVIIRNEDGGTTSDQAYKSVPFYLSSRGYGLLVNSPGPVEFEVGTERVSQVQFAVPGEVLDYYLFLGPDPKAVLEKYTRLSGRPALPPAWSFGLWLSTSFTTQYNEQTVNEFVDGMAKRDIPLSVFHFDCFWMKERHWCDFEWDRAAFPDPPAMLRRLKSRGLKVCLWINPYISQLSSMFREGSERGYFLKRADGSVYQRTQWQPGMAFVDFTNPAAVQWYRAKLRALLEMGVDCFKTDFGERIPDDAVYHDGSDPRLMHNYYTYLYNKAVFELLEEFHGKGNALVFARSATTGGHKFPVHWGGDCDATFESMAEDLRGGLSFCMSGAAFWSHDIGGFSGTANASLYKRWVAFGLLSTHSRLHGSGSYRVPWLFDEESVDVMRHFVKLKNRLFPYLFAAAHDAAEHGWPVMRAMPLEFPNDPGCLHLEHQYMLGSSLLVAPVMREDDQAEYYLPPGRWTHLLTGANVEGGTWRREKLDYFQIPLFVRPNTVLPMATAETRPDWNVQDELTLNLFQIADGASLTVRAAGSSGLATFICIRRGNRITLESDGSASHVRIHLYQPVERVSNGKLLREGARGSIVEWTQTSQALTVTLSG